MDATKWVLPKDITIRVVNKTTGKVKNVFPTIANNKQLMKTSGHEIADPQYDAKMEAFKNNRPFIENGKSKEPVKESFAPIDEPKACCNSISTVCAESDSLKLPPYIAGKEYVVVNDSDGKISTYGPASEEVINKPKRTRRTKEQMKQSKLQK